jgi:hypothetical protein
MTFLFLFIGIGFAILGLRTYLGVDKFWWWSQSTPVVPTGIVFGAFPASFLFLLMAYIFRPSVPVEMRMAIADYIGVPLIFLTLIFSMWQPRWLKPKWLRWLETHHRPILGQLREEARKEKWREWQRRVQTQKGLEEWVEEVRHRYKFDHPDQRFIGDPFE